MLPFLKPKAAAAIIMSKRASDGTVKSEQPEGAENSPLMSIAEKLISAVHAKDAAAMVAVLEALEARDAAADESSEAE